MFHRHSLIGREVQKTTWNEYDIIFSFVRLRLSPVVHQSIRPWIFRDMIYRIIWKRFSTCSLVHNIYYTLHLDFSWKLMFRHFASRIFLFLCHFSKDCDVDEGWRTEFVRVVHATFFFFYIFFYFFYLIAWNGFWIFFFFFPICGLKQPDFREKSVFLLIGQGGLPSLHS